MNTDYKSPAKYFIFTFGCQMNEHDSEHMAGILEATGYLLADEQSEADVIVLNTCCIRETAENKVFGLLGRLGKQKKQRPGLILCLGGCMSQQAHMGARIKERFRYVDVVFGTHNIHQLPELITRAAEERRQIIEVWPDSRGVSEGAPAKRQPGVKAWVSVTYGCNNFCTYCIVPYVRGRERSRTPAAIIDEVAALGRDGYKEITLLGQNVNSYGKDWPADLDFADLLTAVNNVAGIERIRFMTSHPRDFCDKLITAVAKLPKVCEQIHLPVQTGSNNLLRLMNRGYTRESYLRLVEQIKAALPGVALTTDIMVGFPGETDADFAATVDLVQRVEFDSAFTFVYNKRKGTPAATMVAQVPEELKSARIQALIALQNEITMAKNKAEVGTAPECLVEGHSRDNDAAMSARTRTGKIVFYRGAPEQIGMLLPLRITGSSLTHLDGETV